jgi:YVTN family beta-propeller protein
MLIDWNVSRFRCALASCCLIPAWLGLAVASAQTPVPALLVLEKGDNTLAVVDPGTLKVVGRVPAGGDPHEIVVSPDGKLAYISNYGGLDSALNTITVVDLASQKALAPISLGPLRSAHGLDFAGGKLYFTVETNKAFGRYDPATRSVDWVLGTGQDRTHMIVVSEAEDRIVTSNVNSGSISIVERVVAPRPPGAPAQGPPRKTWQITTVPSGRGSEGFDVSPGGSEIWSANALDNTITIIDVQTKKPVSTFPVSVEHANRLKFTPDGKRVFVSGLGATASSGGANLTVLDAATHKEIKKLDLGGGSAGILFAPGGRAYVAVSAKDKIVAIDLEKLEVVGQLATGKGPDGLAWAQSK